MPQESTRRVISRTSRKSTEPEQQQDSSSSKIQKTNDDSKEKHSYRLKDPIETKTNSVAVVVQQTKKEPYNDDIELEETTIDQNLQWKEQVTDKFRDLLQDVKRIKQETGTKVRPPPPHVLSNLLTLKTTTLLNSSKKNVSLQDDYKMGLLLCTTIKKLNRVSHLRVSKARGKTNDVKNKIDEHHLELQNLLYEISHVKKEINKCLDFRSLDEDINLVPVEEFYKNAPASISIPDITKNDEHKLKLARLDWELNERQSMVAKIKELEQTIEKYQGDIKSKREQLDSLQPKLNQIIDACKPTLEFLNMNFNDDCSINEFIQLLPKPLYTLYMMLNGYKDMVNRFVRIEVAGDLEEAKRFDFNKTIDFDDDDSDSGVDDDNENENYKKKKSKSKLNKQMKNSKEKLFSPYPLHIKVTFTVKNVGQIFLNVHYLNLLKIVTVKPDFKLDKDLQLTDSSLLRPEMLFKCVYPNDTGLESPNISNKFIFNSLGITSIENYLTHIGYPYKWCQVLCGLYYYNNSDTDLKTESDEQCGRTVDESIRNEDEMLIDEAATETEVTDVEKMQLNDENNLKNEEEYLFGNSNKNLVIKNESKLMQRIISKLISRFRARVFLQETINSLKKCVLPSLSHECAKHASHFVSKLVSFKETTFEKFIECNYTDHLIAASLIDESQSLFYELNLQNSTAKLQAQIVINEDYPNQTPLFAINIDWKHGRNYKNDESIRDMEREINLCEDNFKESNQAKYYDLLLRQLYHLLTCFDIYLESESYLLKTNEFPRSKFFLDAVRGKDRKRPYSYVSTRDIYMQRLEYTTTADNLILGAINL